MTAQAWAPSHPSASLRTLGGGDFPMAAAGRGGVQREGASCYREWEAPACALVSPPVCAHEPGRGLLRMAGQGPPAPSRRERMVAGTTDLGLDDPALVMAPATHVRGEGAQQGT
jgi:hypothetical protein